MPLPILVAEDLSAVGGVSLGAAWTILNGFGQPVVGLPTSLLSAHTGGFGQPAKQALTDWLPATFQHWQQQNFQFQTALIGYLGSQSLIAQFATFLQQQSIQQVILDPVMADQGELYQGFTAQYVAEIRRLLPQADVILPNLTEAQLLAELPLKSQMTAAELSNLGAKLQRLSEGAAVLITDVPFGTQTGCWWLGPNGQQQLSQERIPGHYFGSGDALAATLTGLLAAKVPFDQAVQLALTWIHQAIGVTHEQTIDARWGIQTAPILRQILTFTAKHQIES